VVIELNQKLWSDMEGVAADAAAEEMRDAADAVREVLLLGFCDKVK
jgi:hypothetical protein